MENVQYVELTALQQLNDPNIPQSLPTISSNGVGAVIRTQANGNGECDFRRTAGELERTKTSIFDRCQHLEIVLLAVVILVVSMVLLLPIVFYHLPLPPVSYKHDPRCAFCVNHSTKRLWSSCIENCALVHRECFYQGL